MNRERIKMLEDEYLAEHPGTAGTVHPLVFSPDDLAVAVNLKTTSPMLRAKILDDQFSPLPVITDMSLADNWQEAGKTWVVDSSTFGQWEYVAYFNAFLAEFTAYVQEYPTHGFGIVSIGQYKTCLTAYEYIGG